MGETSTFHLHTFNAGEDPTENGYQHFDADRHRIDAVLQAMGTHHHNGLLGSDETPLDPPSLALDALAGGVAPAGVRIYYRYTYVDVNGLETAASPEAFIDTPEAVSAPGAPSGIVNATTGGVLLPGLYYYKLSAYVGQSTVDTRPGQPVWITVPPGTATNAITFTLPTLPTGADGFNVWRKKPGGDYGFLTAIDMTGMSPPTTFEDDGSIVDDCLRRPPVINTTNSGYAIDVTLPGATPVVPEGYTWRIYRTIRPGDYSQSLIAWVVEETSEGSGIITPYYTDLYHTAIGGAPPTGTNVINSPEKVLLTDAEEVQGVLPPANHMYTYAVEFSFPGTLEEVTGTFQWRCPFYRAYIREVLVNLGIDSSPFADDVVVDVIKGDNQLATPTRNSIFPTSPMPTILIGEEVGDPAIPDIQLLWRDDFLSVDILQVGGGATPTDYDLSVQILLWVIEQEVASIDVFD